MGVLEPLSSSSCGSNKADLETLNRVWRMLGDIERWVEGAGEEDDP